MAISKISITRELLEFPPESRFCFYPYACSLKKYDDIKSNDPKKFETFQTQVLHYFK